MIALSHRTRFSHKVYCANDADALTLFERAQAGDTMHFVADYREDEVPELMNQIGSQLLTGQYKLL